MGRRTKFTEEDLREFQAGTEQALGVAAEAKDYDKLEKLTARRRKLLTLLPNSGEAKKERKPRATAAEKAEISILKQRVFAAVDDLKLSDEDRDAAVSRATKNEFVSMRQLTLRGSIEDVRAVHRHLMSLQGANE